MKKYEALMTTGKLEVRLQDKEQLVEVVETLQSCILNNDIHWFAVYLGRLIALLDTAGIDEGENIKSLYDFLVAAQEKKNEPEQKQEQKIKKITLESPLEDLGFSTGAYNSLHRRGLKTLGDLVELSTYDLMKIRLLGRMRQEEVIFKLKELGYTLKSEED